jgi:hypothetical protein
MSFIASASADVLQSAVAWSATHDPVTEWRSTAAQAQTSCHQQTLRHMACGHQKAIPAYLLAALLCIVTLGHTAWQEGREAVDASNGAEQAAACACVRLC